jgi:hypothetical protein
MWLVNPTLADHAHRNGVLSFVYLMLSSPLGKYFASEAIRKSAVKLSGTTSIRAHLRNIFCDAINTALFVPSFGVRRFLLKRKVPGFFQPSNANQYDLHYHAEQIPNWESHVTLSNNKDELGMPRLNIDYRFHEQDIDSVIRAHSLLDSHLRQYNVGSLEYTSTNLASSVWDQASDGYHQTGTTRMSTTAKDGVVDVNCKVHGTENLYVVSGSTFVTSGQANTTFLIVVFAIRLAQYLSSRAE